jgi:transposase InsO family protein
VLAAAVGYLFRRRRGRYGSPRITADLKELGWAVSANTVAALMAEQRLVARPRHRRRGSTRADRLARKAPDLLGRHFTPPPVPDVAWTGDLTEVPNDEGKLYCAHVLDLHSRRIVGFVLGEHHDPELARAALCMAIAVRGGNADGVIFHSDQGGEYTGAVFARACRQAGVRQSMGRTGSALDNAVSESLNSTMEFELFSLNHFTTRAQARAGVTGWVQEYNEERRHSTDGMLAPAVYELAARNRREAA